MNYRTYRFLRTYKAYLAFLLGFLPSLFLYGWYYYKKRPAFIAEDTGSNLYSQLTGLPEGAVSEMKLPEIIVEEQIEDFETEEVPDARLRVLSGMAIPIMGETLKQEGEVQEATESAKKMAGVRIIGEVQNIGEKKVSGAKSVLRFYDKDEKLLATKIGNFTKGYEFLELAPGEVNVYDILVPNPPESETISIQMSASAKASADKKGSAGVSLKIKDKNLEETSLTTEDEVEIIYYKFSAVLVNTGEDEVANPGIYVWLKDDENKVIATSYKVFEADLMIPEQELEANLLLVPLGDKAVFSHEAKVFGEKL